jgi:hypothetical protein
MISANFQNNPYKTTTSDHYRKSLAWSPTNHRVEMALFFELFRFIIIEIIAATATFFNST